MDRDGQVTIQTRNSMSIDPERRTVTFSCFKRPCKFRQAYDLDALIITLAQTFTRSWGLPIDGSSDNWDDMRPRRHPRRRINAWEHLAVEPSGLTDDEKRDWRIALSLYIAEYQSRRKPEIVTDSKGHVTMILP